MRINTAKTCMFCMRFGLTIVILQILLLRTTFAQVSIQKADSLWKKTGTAEIEYFYNQHGLIKAITNYTFLRSYPNRADLRRAGRLPEIIIAQASRNEYGNYEGSFPKLTAEAYLTVQGKLETPLWKLSEEAHHGTVKYVDAGWKYYETSYSEGSDGGTVYRLYNLYSGKEVLQRTSNLLSAMIPNTMQIRLIGYKRPGPVRNGFIGTLYYVSADSILHELKFFLKDPVLRGDMIHLAYLGDDLALIDAPHPRDVIWRDSRISLGSSSGSYDPKSFTGFSIKLSYYRDVEVKIPIKNDDFDLSNFTSDLYRIERIK